MCDLLIIKTGSTFDALRNKQGDFDDWVLQLIPGNQKNIKVIKAQVQPEYPDPKTLSGIIITGSHDNVTDHLPWMLHLMSWIKLAVQKNVPVLGICFGHQILAKALGGKIGFHPAGGEFGLAPVELFKGADSDPLLKYLPKQFHVFVSHEQSILSLPDGAAVLARNNHEPHHIVRFRTNVYGLQFHPEFNPTVARFYLKTNRGKGKLGTAPEIHEAVLIGNQLAHNFIELCLT